MPYRVDIQCPPPNAADLLIDLGALDVEASEDGLAAILPDGLTREAVASVLGRPSMTVSAAMARDNNSVWLLSPRPVRIGNMLIGSPETGTLPSGLRLTDSAAFGTGHHPTTALCLEALEEMLTGEPVDKILDVGTGSGILALIALTLGVRQAVGVDTDPQALSAAAENARLNNLADRLQLVLGGPDAVTGSWPLVVANVLAAPLIDMAPVLVRRVASRGQLVLSGIPSSLEADVKRAYAHFGMGHITSKTRSGWTRLTAQACW